MDNNNSQIGMKGRRILVTGASSGIGRETAIAISRSGGKVLGVGRRQSELESTLSQLDGEGHRVESFDLTDVDSIPAWLQGLAKEFGQFDGLAHMAGILESRPLKVSDAAFVDNILKVNVGTSIGLARGFRHKKVRAKSSSIVFASSVAALIGEGGISAYSASKGAIISLTQALASELAREGIRVNCVSPAVVQTEMTERFHKTLLTEQQESVRSQHLLGLGSPPDVSALIVFLLSDLARWMTGSNVVIDGGYSTK